MAEIYTSGEYTIARMQLILYHLSSFITRFGGRRPGLGLLLHVLLLCVVVVRESVWHYAVLDLLGVGGLHSGFSQSTLINIQNNDTAVFPTKCYEQILF